jgi:L,D-transpeptidase YcbB
MHLRLRFCILAMALSFAHSGLAMDPAPVDTVTEAADGTSPSAARASTPAAAPSDPFTSAVLTAVTAQRPSDDDALTADLDAIQAFYSSRNGVPLWSAEGSPTESAQMVMKELENADAWGLNAKALPLKALRKARNFSDTETQAHFDLQLTKAVLLYARHARGGRIAHPAEQLNSHLNRMPQLLPPHDVLSGLAEAPDKAEYLTSLHPQHQQFQRLRSVYLSIRKPRAKLAIRLPNQTTLAQGDRHRMVPRLRERLGLRSSLVDAELFDRDLNDAVRNFQIEQAITPADGRLTPETVTALNKRPAARTDRILANMEAWRWMWDDLGDLHILANVPEYMINVVKYGDVLFRERVVVGQVDKQSSIFTRTLKHIVLRPMWRVPESIKVKELWPSLRRGGGLFRQHNLILETKDGRPLNWRKIDWHKADIRDYEVVQRPSRNGAMGRVKFSFPSQHTIFIHDTPDKYMFKYKRRTLSHGCLRLRNPVEMAKLLLAESEGLDGDEVDQLIKSGPNRNAIKIARRIPVHIVYFTAWVDDAGRLKTFSDIYGHEKRIRLALAGKWDQINKGRNHLAPPTPVVARSGTSKRKRARPSATRDHIRAAFGGGF